MLTEFGVLGYFYNCRDAGEFVTWEVVAFSVGGVELVCLEVLFLVNVKSLLLLEFWFLCCHVVQLDIEDL